MAQILVHCMPLFDNPFYSDEDCKMVYKTRSGWGFETFDRERLNHSAAYRTPFQRDLDNLTFCGMKCRESFQFGQIHPRHADRDPCLQELVGSVLSTADCVDGQGR